MNVATKIMPNEKKEGYKTVSMEWSQLPNIKTRKILRGNTSRWQLYLSLRDSLSVICFLSILKKLIEVQLT